jgi:Zn-finger nucleic acid-binding protein
MMSTVEKNGVHLEQCAGCRGIFLDRGELEQIIGAENAYYGGPARYRPDSPAPYGGGYRDSPRPYRGGRPDSPRPHYGDSPRPYRGHRKRSFLENLFD